LVAHADQDLRDTVAAALREVAGRCVVATSDGVLALIALWLSDDPVVALIDECLLPFGGMDVFGMMANDQAAGHLARHRYVLLSTWPEHIPAKGRELLARLGAPVLSLPFELDELIHMVDEADEVIAAEIPLVTAEARALEPHALDGTQTRLPVGEAILSTIIPW
jgi:hypothetical protein